MRINASTRVVMKTRIKTEVGNSGIGVVVVLVDVVVAELEMEVVVLL